MAVLLFLNLKGGVAKTTTAVAVAETLADRGKRVLVIDADHQCAASELLLGGPRLSDCEHRRRTLHDLFAEMLDGEIAEKRFESFVERPASNIRNGLPQLAVLPCSLRIEDFSTNMARAQRGYRAADEWMSALRRPIDSLRRWLVGGFDYTIVDCPPGVPFQVRTLLKCADTYIIPTIPDKLSLHGSLGLIDRLRRAGIKKRGLGTLWTLFKSNNTIHQRFIERASQQAWPLSILPRPFKTIIPNATAIARATESQGHPATLSAKYEPQFAQLFSNLCQEIIWRLHGVVPM